MGSRAFDHGEVSFAIMGEVQVDFIGVIKDLEVEVEGIVCD